MNTQIMAPPSSRVESDPTGSESARQIHASSPSPAGTVLPEPSTRTRSGRVSKPPVRYEPVEQVEDDYADDDYDTDESDVSSTISSDSDEEEIDESDADDDGNLDGFVVPDKTESDVSDSDDDGEPPVPVKKQRPAVKKRPAAFRK
jgi:hypothetical protein